MEYTAFPDISRTNLSTSNLLSRYIITMKTTAFKTFQVDRNLKSKQKRRNYIYLMYHKFITSNIYNV